MSEVYGSQHGNVPPIPEDSYLAWYLEAQARLDAQARLAEQRLREATQRAQEKSMIPFRR